MKEKRETVFKILRISRLHRKIVEHEIQQTGVYRSQHHMLMNLSRNPAASQTEIAQALEITPATVAVTLKKLEAGGYIKRSTCDDDNRFKQVEITKKGLDVVEQSHQIFSMVDEKMFDGFSEEELEQVNQYYNRMLKNLQVFENERRKNLDGEV